MPTGRVLALLAALAAMALLAACAPEDPELPPDFTPGPIDYTQLRGDVRMDGSSTVFPISEAMAEEFSKVSRVRVNVAFSGTGGGLEKLCRGEIDLAGASRPIRENELETCADHGIEVVEFRVAMDALTIVVNDDNDWAACVTVEDLYEAFRYQGADSWEEIRPEWPDEDLILYYPGPDSGTFDYFVERVIEEVDPEAWHRGDGTTSEDDNILGLGVANDLYSLGYFGFAFYQEASDALRPLSVDGGEGCREPSEETVLAGSYPLARPLFVYAPREDLEERPEVVGFLEFVLTRSAQIVPEVGYVALAPQDVQTELAQLEPFFPAAASATAR